MRIAGESRVPPVPTITSITRVRELAAERGEGEERQGGEEGREEGQGRGSLPSWVDIICSRQVLGELLGIRSGMSRTLEPRMIKPAP